MKVLVMVQVYVEVDDELTKDEIADYARDEWTNSDDWIISDIKLPGPK